MQILSSKVTKFVNPFFIYGFSWGIVLLIYEFGWSQLCPPLSNSLLSFLFGTVVVSFLIGNSIQKTIFKNICLFDYVPRSTIRNIGRFLKILLLLFVVEVVACGGIPLLGLISGNIGIKYTEFGLPILHVLVVNGLSVIIIISYWLFKCTKVSENKKQLKKYFYISFIPFILMVNRAVIMNCVLGVFLIKLFTSSKPLKALLTTSISVIIVLFLFGYMGNLRTGNGSASVILQIGKATERFKESIIPKEFFWSYIYLTTPLANTQNTINNSEYANPDVENLSDFVLYECIPTILSKRVSEGKESKYAAKLITEDLNVSSVYGRCYNYLGWSGILLMFLFILFFIYFNLLLIKRPSPYYIPMVVVLDIIIFMNVFTNMFIFMGLVPQLLFLIIIDYLHYRKIKI